MILIVVAQSIIHVNFSFEIGFQSEIHNARAVRGLVFADEARAADSSVVAVGGFVAVCVVDDDFLDFVREVEEGYADGDEGDAYDEEGGEDGACC